MLFDEERYIVVDAMPSTELKGGFAPQLTPPLLSDDIDAGKRLVGVWKK